jgi:hypothetical protein
LCTDHGQPLAGYIVSAYPDWAVRPSGLSDGRWHNWPITTLPDQTEALSHISFETLSSDGPSSFDKGHLSMAVTATRTLRIQNTYDSAPCSPRTLVNYQHAGDAYLIAFYNKDAGWLDPLPDRRRDRRVAQARPSTRCWFWFLAATEEPRIGSATSSAAGTTSLLGVTTVKGR